MSRYVDGHRDRFGVEPICRTLGVSVSAYYQRRNGQRSPRAVEDERLLERIREEPPDLGTSAPGVDEAREHAIASLKRKRKFAQDAVAFVAVNGLLWLIWLITDRSTNGSGPWPAWVSLAWGFFLALDGWRAYGRWPASLNTPITETEIDRELERTQSR